jgi:hypothetical protein
VAAHAHEKHEALARGANREGDRRLGARPVEARAAVAFPLAAEAAQVRGVVRAQVQERGGGEARAREGGERAERGQRERCGRVAREAVARAPGVVGGAIR